jgi:hypothetical protein
MEMPEDDRGDFRGCLKVDLHPLNTGAELDVRAVAAGFVTVGDQFELPDDGKCITRCDGFVFRQIDGAGRDHDLGPAAGLGLFQIRELEWARSSDEERTRQFELQWHFICGEGGACERTRYNQEGKEGTQHVERGFIN